MEKNQLKIICQSLGCSLYLGSTEHWLNMEIFNLQPIFSPNSKIIATVMGKFIIIMSLYSISSFLLYFELYWNWDNFQTSTVSLMHHISVSLHCSINSLLEVPLWMVNIIITWGTCVWTSGNPGASNGTRESKTKFNT